MTAVAHAGSFLDDDIEHFNRYLSISLMGIMQGVRLASQTMSSLGSTGTSSSLSTMLALWVEQHCRIQSLACVLCTQGRTLCLRPQASSSSHLRAWPSWSQPPPTPATEQVPVTPSGLGSP